MKTWAKLRKFRHVDVILFLSTVALAGIGTVMVYSASSLTAAERFGDSAHYLKRHLVALVLGLAAMGGVFLVNIRMLRKFAWPSFFGVGVLLLLTLLTSAGHEANQATRWMTLGGLSFQPSELAKPAIVIYVAAYLARKGSKIQEFFSGLLPLLLSVGAVCLLVLRQPDFGTSVVIATTVFVMLFAGRARVWHLGSLSLLGVGALASLIFSASYRRERLLSFLHPWEDPQGKGFQILQSFIAFRHGGLGGQGLGDSTQKLLYLPEAHTDFICSVIAEELGLVGTLLVIVLFAVVVVQGFRLAVRLFEPFSYQLAVGLTTIFGLQAFLNMAVAMGLVPTKGLPLPLVSYGGTSLVVSLASIGILLSLSSTTAMAGRMARRKRK